MTSLRRLCWTTGVLALAALPILALWLEISSPAGSFGLGDLGALLYLLLPASILGLATNPTPHPGRVGRRLLMVAGLASWALQAYGLEGAWGLLFLGLSTVGVVLMVASGLAFGKSHRKVNTNLNHGEKP